MATALDVINVARTQIGFIEGSNNENPYGIWYGIPNESYCAMGVSWCFAQVGLSNLIAAQTPKGFSYCPTGLTWFQRQGLVVNKFAAQPGDIVFFSWAGNGVADHVGLVENASAIGLTTIEFNTTPEHATGNQANGGGCYRRQRNMAYVIAIVRPKYPVLIKPAVSPSTTKKATAGVAATGAGVAGALGASHPVTSVTNPTPTPSPTIWVAPPFPTSPTAFVVGATNDGVLTIEKGLQKLGLLPAKYVDGNMTKETTAALIKFEKANPVVGIKDGTVNQITYDILKAKI